MKHEEVIKFCMGSFLFTGSRYFNMYAPDIVPINSLTDYDFTAPASSPWLKEFESIPGVKRVIINPDYQLQDVAYWLMYDEPTTMDTPCVLHQTKPQIQVIVRPSYAIYNAYREVFSRITPEFYRDYLWKSAPGNPKDKKLVGERMDLLLRYEMCER